MGEGRQLGREERDADRGRQMKDRAARRRVDEADEVAPFVAMLHRRQRALPVETPDFVQDGFQPDPVLVDGPELDGAVRVRRRDLAEERAELFLKASCAAGSACICRGRGLRRLPSRRTR